MKVHVGFGFLTLTEPEHTRAVIDFPVSIS